MKTSRTVIGRIAIAKVAVGCAAALSLSGCISFGPKPPKTLLTLVAASTVSANTARRAGPGQTVTILYPTAPAAISVPRVPVYDRDGTITYVKGIAWNDTPSHLFQNLMSEVVASKTGKVVVDVRQYTLDPGSRVSGQLLKFGVDAQAMQAVVVYDAILMRSGATGIETRRFEARVPVTAVDATVGTALNSAANDVATQVAGWVG
ncbi:ABC-type transport auxiliary lipoprotein family protein [Sphingomonas sp.]|uniref:ABC-type transport auxiliary lipoprotein family protein n=1 Tax=Sphingomonas sp. TaxID=28214 RepID=UPI0025D81F2C|nr:ABC-type transport auxiliary lipoprotein family protein [Sphingomonas sp.]